MAVALPFCQPFRMRCCAGYPQGGVVLAMVVKTDAAYGSWVLAKTIAELQALGTFRATLTYDTSPKPPGSDTALYIDAAGWPPAWTTYAATTVPNTNWANVTKMRAKPPDTIYSFTFTPPKALVITDPIDIAP